MLSQLVFAAVGVLLVAVSIPLILRKVPRNDWYGLRTPKTIQGSDEDWYDANHDAGLGICAVGILTLAAALVAMVLYRRTALAGTIVAAILGLSTVAELARTYRKHWKP